MMLWWGLSSLDLEFRTRFENQNLESFFERNSGNPFFSFKFGTIVAISSKKVNEKPCLNISLIRMPFFKPWKLLRTLEIWLSNGLQSKSKLPRFQLFILLFLSTHFEANNDSDYDKNHLKCYLFMVLVLEAIDTDKRNITIWFRVLTRWSSKNTWEGFYLKKSW